MNMHLGDVNDGWADRMSSPTTHLQSMRGHNRRLQQLRQTDSEQQLQQPATIYIRGDDLSHAELIAVACYEAETRIADDPSIYERMSKSVDFLRNHLKAGNVVYGINTGYGGSADTRSDDAVNMQRAAIQHHNSAILLPSDTGRLSAESHQSWQHSHALPRSVVRGAMLARCSSLLRGHSAVRTVVVEALLTLLNLDFVPVVPLRGSISASGDLTPLAYIAGTLEGNSDLFVDCKSEWGRRVMTADMALPLAGLESVVLQAKESLGLMNGTAVSCAASCMALHQVQYLLLAAQCLTAMCTEALGGSADNFHPFISETRPHIGQEEVAENIRRQLRGSKLVVGKTAKTAGLYQDRYALRTAPQWLGPQLEDLRLAAGQIGVELNSTTDNPLIDTQEGVVHHGGNFQAASLTSAMEKTRIAVQMIGKLLFAQSTELINPVTNNTLPPNLTFDDPGTSFTFKGVDINMASYISELGFLSNPVSSHVQSAEMHNQSVNSLALISARYTMDAADVLTMMTATHFYTLCQALDLHVLFMESAALIEHKACQCFQEIFADCPDVLTGLDEVLASIPPSLIMAKNQDLSSKARAVAEATTLPIIKSLLKGPSGDASAVSTWTQQLENIVADSINSTRFRFANGDLPTVKYLGAGTAMLYSFIRHELGVPLHRGLVEHPPMPRSGDQRVKKLTIGSQITIIYEALRNGRMNDVLIGALSAD